MILPCHVLQRRQCHEAVKDDAQKFFAGEANQQHATVDEFRELLVEGHQDEHDGHENLATYDEDFPLDFDLRIQKFDAGVSSRRDEGME